MFISYQLPRLGLLTTSLHKEAAHVFDVLSTEGEIERLKNLDHLGIIRRASEGAHHPRWESVMLIFKLIDLAKTHAPQSHLATGIDISDSVSISSGTECLKVWTLLVNIGHLPLTFTAEKALLHELRSEPTAKWPELKKQMISSIPRQRPLKRFIKRVIEQEKVYSFYQAIAAWRLQNWVKQGKAPQIWLDILEKLLVPESGTTKTRALVQLHRKLRSLAYLIIDPAYTPALVSVDVQQIFTNPGVLANVLFESERQYIRIFDAIQEHLYETAYLTPKVALHTAAVVPTLRQRIKESAGEGLEITMHRLLQGDLQKGAGTDAAGLRHVLRLAYKVDPSLTQDLFADARPLEEESAWIARMGKHRKFIRVTVWPFADNRNRFVDVFVYQNAPFSARVRAFVTAIGMMAQQYKQQWVAGSAHEWLQTTLYSDVTASLIESLLKELFTAVKRWEFVPHRFQKRKLAVFASRKSAAIGHVIEAAERIKRDNAIRSSELAAVLRSLTTENIEGASYAVLLCALKGYDETGRTMVEFDGIYLRQHSMQLEVVVVEAKDRAKGGKAAALRQLQATIEKLTVRPHWAVTFDVFARGKVAKIASPSFSTAKFRISESASDLNT